METHADFVAPSIGEATARVRERFPGAARIPLGSGWSWLSRRATVAHATLDVRGYAVVWGDRVGPRPDWLRPGAWRGRRVFVVGGGPSLREFDWLSLGGESAIAVNRSYERLPLADVLFSIDARFYGWHLPGIREFRGLPVWGDVGPHPHVPPPVPGIVSVRCPEALAWGRDLETLGHGGHSGYAAANLADVLVDGGTIYLLGCDLRGADGRQAWWHDGYPIVQAEDVYAGYRRSFEWAAEHVPGLADRIRNLSPDSALRAFPTGAAVVPPPPLPPPLVVSFATPRYHSAMARLEASLARHGISAALARHDEEPASWAEGCARKPAFLASVLRGERRPVLWLDADAEVLSPLDWFRGLETADVAVHRRAPSGEVLSGTVWLSGSPASLALVEEWATRAWRDPGTWDQKHLAAALAAVPCVEAALPATYVRIFDRPEMGEAVILHHQASRAVRAEEARRVL